MYEEIIKLFSISNTVKKHTKGSPSYFSAVTVYKLQIKYPIVITWPAFPFSASLPDQYYRGMNKNYI